MRFTLRALFAGTIVLSAGVALAQQAPAPRLIWAGPAPATQPDDLAMAVDALAPAMTIADETPAAPPGQPAPAAGEEAAPEPADAPTTQPQGRNPLPHVRIDKARRRVYVDGTSLSPGDLLELIACTPFTRDHEAVMRCLARPSHVHLALMLCGFAPGHPVQWDDKTRTVIPPTGDRVDVMVQWKDKETGKVLTSPVTDWMAPIDPKAAMPKQLHFIFTGSVLLEDGGYLADAEGTVVSVANFPDSVIDLSGVHSRNNDLLDFRDNPKAMPPRDTPCELLLLPPADLRVGLDRFGKITVEGHALEPDARKPEAGRLDELLLSKLQAQRRSRDDAYVQIQADPDAVKADLDKLTALCRKAGFADADIRVQKSPTTQPDAMAFPINDPLAAIDLLTGQWREHSETVAQAVEAQRDLFSQLEDRRRTVARQYGELADYVRRAQGQYRQTVGKLGE
ncbi:MAG: hypothetical protein BIFFINMI_03974 [Phycisphaerae bacterium]|nr:hypothetical protein [Phycisphaerae bacterium]